jgi:hypothetical protein
VNQLPGEAGLVALARLEHEDAPLAVGKRRRHGTTGYSRPHDDDISGWGGARGRFFYRRSIVVAHKQILCRQTITRSDGHGG